MKESFETLQAELAALRQRVAEAEAALRERNHLLHATINAMPAAVSIRDLHGRFVEINDQQAARWQRDPAAIIGKVDADLLPKNIVGALRAREQQVIATRQTQEFEQHTPHAGKLHTYRTITFPITAASGELAAIGEIAIDITADKQTQPSLSDHETLFQTIMENTPDGISLSQTDGTFVYANAAYRAMTGQGDDLLGLTIFDVYAEPLEILGDIAYESASSGYWKGMLTIQQPDGTSVPCEVSITALGTADDPIFATIARDLTEQRRLEQERLALQAQVIATQEATLRELSTPLIPIADYVVAMPLVGAIDDTRAQQILETLLEGVAAHHAVVAIMDITGVSVVDTQVANALVQAAQAGKLLGAQVVLTGIHPEVAQTLVQLGADLHGIVTRSTLQLGIAYALKLVSSS